MHLHVKADCRFELDVTTLVVNMPHVTVNYIPLYKLAHTVNFVLCMTFCAGRSQLHDSIMSNKTPSF